MASPRQDVRTPVPWTVSRVEPRPVPFTSRVAVIIRPPGVSPGASSGWSWVRPVPLPWHGPLVQEACKGPGYHLDVVLPVPGPPISSVVQWDWFYFRTRLFQKRNGRDNYELIFLQSETVCLKNEGRPFEKRNGLMKRNGPYKNETAPGSLRSEYLGKEVDRL